MPQEIERSNEYVIFHVEDFHPISGSARKRDIKVEFGQCWGLPVIAPQDNLRGVTEIPGKNVKIAFLKNPENGSMEGPFQICDSEFHPDLD